MEDNKMYVVYKVDNGMLIALHYTLEGVYNRLSHRGSDEYKLYHIVNGLLSKEITQSDELYDGCKVAQVQIKSALCDFVGCNFEIERVDYEIKTIKLNK